MTISEATKFLENAFDILNAQYFNSELPRAVITIQSSPKAYGHFTPWESWHEGDNGFNEINIGAETLSRNIENTISTLIHEMTHFYCHLNGIKDTSRGGTYHNKRFKVEAESRDLIINYDPRIGWSVTTPSESLIAFIQAQGWSGIDLSRVGAQSNSGRSGGKGVSNVRKYQCPQCQCSVRATKAVNVGCLDCGCPMELAG